MLTDVDYPLRSRAAICGNRHKRDETSVSSPRSTLSVADSSRTSPTSADVVDGQCDDPRIESLMSVSFKSVAATLTAAALLVIGIDYTTYAATGDSLILGQKNSTHKATQLVRRAAGPALILKSRGSARPSLRVSSTARVPRLNADRLDGLDASRLSSDAVTYVIGRQGQVVPGAGTWSLDIAPGQYQVTFKVLATPAETPGQVGGMLCGVVDLDTLGPNTQVYTAASGNVMDGGTGNPIAMSGAEAIRVSVAANPGVYCGSNSSEFTLFAASASFTKITTRRVKQAASTPLPFRTSRGRIALAD